MLTELPEPQHRSLPAAPLELVVWQLQFAEPADVAAPRVGTELAASLSADDGPPVQLQRVAMQTLAVAFGPGGPVPAAPMVEQAPAGQGWQLRRDSLAITVNPQAVSVETTAYPGWEAFRGLLARVLERLQSLVAMPGEQRLGLRYVDRVVHPDVRRVEDWKPWLAEWLHGPLVDARLAGAVLALAQQVDFDAGAGTRATLRYRAFADPEQRQRQTVMLDFDCFREGYRLFDAEDVVVASDHLNDTSHRLFEASITPPLYATFQETP